MEKNEIRNNCKAILIFEQSSNSDCKTIMEKLSSLFDNESVAFSCLLELQEHCVIAGSSIAFALSDVFIREDIGDVDLFLLKGQDFHFIQKIISKYFTILSYKIVHNEYDEDRCPEDISCKPFKLQEVSVITLEINDRINFQVIMTNWKSVSSVLNNFDFDYISVAIYQNKIYGEEEASLSWREKRVLQSKTTDVYTHRFQKTLKKRFRMPLYKVKSKADISYESIFDLSSIIFIPMNDKEISLPIDFTKLKIVDVQKEEGLIFTSKNNLISKAIFTLSDGNNTFTTEEVAVRMDESFTLSKYYHNESSTVFVKPYILYENGYGKIKFFITRDVSQDIADYVIPFDLAVCSSLEKKMELNSQEILNYIKHKYELSQGNKIVRSAWEAFYSSYKDGNFSDAARLALGTYYYDKAKAKGHSYYPYDIHGKMILPSHLEDKELTLLLLERYIQ